VRLRNHRPRDVRRPDPYPRDDWHEFLNTVGVDEEIIGTPHCSSPRDTDELDAQYNGGVTRRSA